MEPSGLIFAIVFIAFFVLRAIAAALFFYWLLPRGDRCPCCDTPTIRVESPWWNRLMPWFRTSWCFHCGWEGLLRHGVVTPLDAPARAQTTVAARNPSSGATDARKRRGAR